MVQRFRVSKYKSALLTCLIPDPRDPVGADSYTYTSDKYTYTSDKYAGVVDELSRAVAFRSADVGYSLRRPSRAGAPQSHSKPDTTVGSFPTERQQFWPVCVCVTVT